MPLARIVSNQDLGENWFALEAEAPELAPRVRAGQFVQVRVSSEDCPLIRRPFSIADVLPHPGADAERILILYQVVGPGTRAMMRWQPGESVDLLGPLGRPLPQPAVPDHGLLLLVGGGIGVAPLLLYSHEAIARGDQTPIRVLLGARRRSLLIGWESFERIGVPTEVSTDDGSAGYRGNVVELAQSTISDFTRDSVAGIGCGPHGMNLALRDLAVREEIPFWISLENYMPCGFGACFGCVIPTPDRSGYRRVCTEGPAFPANELPATF